MPSIFDSKQKLVGDKAKSGEATITTPYKKQRKAEISPSKKADNKQLSSRRIGVEHLISRLKIFRVASDRLRLDRHRYSQVIMTVCGLVRLRLNRSVFFALNN
jgi:hypothetical protein